jgi:hypothetical protein
LNLDGWVAKRIIAGGRVAVLAEPRAVAVTDEPKWRNWQTRQVQDLVPVKGVEVRVLSSAPYPERTSGERP